MPGPLEMLCDVAQESLAHEEFELSRMLDRPDDTELKERLRLWTERLQAYERVERALVQHRLEREQSASERLGLLPEAVEHGLALVS